jgi:hypothetical protein
MPQLLEQQGRIVPATNRPPDGSRMRSPQQNWHAVLARPAPSTDGPALALRSDVVEAAGA